MFYCSILKILNSNIFLRPGGWRGGPRAFVLSKQFCVFKTSLNRTDFGKDVTGSTLSFVHMGTQMI